MAASPGKPAFRHVPTLDGVRGLAILMVLGVHIDQSLLIPGTTTVWRCVQRVLWSGWSGVDLFFVLSGFLISSILLNSLGTPNYFKLFYIRRTLRILPLYYLAVLSAMLLVPLFSHSHPWLAELNPGVKGWLSYLFYVQNWYLPIADLESILGHFWSLGVEEQFYLLWPLVIFVTPLRSLKFVCMAGIGIAIAVRFTLLQFVVGNSTIVLTNTFARMDSLLFGAVIALIARDAQSLKRALPLLPWLGVASACGIVAIDGFAHELWSRGYWTQFIGYTLFAILYACLVLGAYAQSGSRSVLDRAFSNGAMRWFGKYSYGIYVYHAVIIVIFTRTFEHAAWFGKSGAPSIGLALIEAAVSCSVAWLSYNLFEKYFLKLKQRYEPFVPKRAQRSAA